nr:DUF4129 domain-containing protein [Flexivirga meconopsidis]
MLWVLFGVVQAVRRQLAQRRAAREDSVLPQVSDAVADAVEQVARRQHARLAEGTPRNAVVACWVDLEQTVATAGLERRPSETSAELALRVLDETDADRDALRTLSRLYRAARYSEHPITEGDRAAAGAALEALHRSLRVKATL